MSNRKRRKFSAEFKAAIVLSMLRGEKSQPVICREHELSAQQFSNWKRQFLENARQAFEQPASAGDNEQIAELERMVGRLTMQLEIKKSLQNLDLNIEQQREVVMSLRGKYPVKTICEVLNCSRSSIYYHSQGPDEADLRTAIERLAGQWVMYSYRRSTKMLQREGWAVNHKRVHRLIWEMDLLQKRKPYTPRTTDSQHSFGRYPNRVQSLRVSEPDQVWVADITYVHLSKSYVYLAVIMNVYTRAIRGWQLSRNLDAQSLTLTA